MATKKPKTQKVVATGKVVRCQLYQQKPQFGYKVYDRGREHYNITLQVTIETEDGRKYWWYTSPADFSINTSGPYSVSIFFPNDWVARSRERWNTEGFAGARGFGQLYESRIAVGDTISIEGRVKNPSTQYGVMLSHVKRTDYSYDAEKRAWDERCAAASRSVPTKIPPDQTPPEIPGVEWSRIGGYPQPDDPDRGVPSDYGNGHRWFGWASQVKSIHALLAHYEGKPVEECQEPR